MRNYEKFRMILKLKNLSKTTYFSFIYTMFVVKLSIFGVRNHML
jgi:hypothetical protein